MRAADPVSSTREALAGGATEILSVGQASGTPRIHLLGAGKAVSGMAAGALDYFGTRVVGGVLAGPLGTGKIGPLDLVPAGHPTPDAGSVQAGNEMLAYLPGLEPGDGVVFLLSGGASAMLERPRAGIPLDSLVAINEALLQRGAAIEDLNAIRTCLSEIKGGGLGAAIAEHPLLTLAISDVVGDAPEVIGSAPTVACRCETNDSIATFRSLRLPMAVIEPAIKAAQEPGAGAGARGPRDYRLVATATDGLVAARRSAERLGYSVVECVNGFAGDAQEAGESLARAVTEEVGDGRCWLRAGETTVAVFGDGLGGRNQEVALASSRALDGVRGVAVAAIGTDGIDGPTPAAGAIATGTTWSRARRLGMDPGGYLRANDSYNFFAELGDLVYTGATGTNVMDLHIGLKMEQE